MSIVPGTRTEMAMLLERVDAWTRKRTAAVGRFLKTELHKFVRSLDRGEIKTPTYELTGQLLAELPGTTKLPGRSGYTRTGVVFPVQTLASLLDAAAGCVDAEYSPPLGRRSSSDLHKINPRQLEDMRRAAALAAEMVTGNPKRTSEVGGEHLAWTALAGEGARGEWDLVARIGEYSDQTARARFESRRSADQPRWHADDNADRRRKHEAGIRNLLNLSATHGLIARGAGSAAVLPYPAAEWHADIEVFHAHLFNEHRSNNVQCLSGVATLTRFASTRGFLTNAETSWAWIQKDIVAAHSAGALNSGFLVNARKVYRKLLADGLIEGPVWHVRGDDRMSLFPLGVITQARQTRDFSDLSLPDGSSPTALCAGPDSLRSLTDWVSLSSSELVYAGLPPRAWPRPTHEQDLTVKRHPKRFRLRPKSVARLLDRLNLIAGFCARLRGVDFSQVGLEALCDPEHLLAYAAHRHPGRVVGSGDLEDGVLSALAGELSWIAAPFLEAQVLRQAADARSNGFHDDAERLQARADQLQAASARFKGLSVEYRTRGKGGIRSVSGPRGSTAADRLDPRDIRRIWEIWTADGVSGWHKIGVLRDILVEQAESEAWKCLGRRGGGRVPVAEQIRIIASDQERPLEKRRFCPRQAWSLAVRNAVILTLLWRIPLRAENLVELELAEWRNTSTGSGTPKRWEGAINLEIAAGKMKSDRPFFPAYLRGTDVDDPNVLAMARPDLLELYFAEGGARDALLTLWRGSARMGLEPGKRVSSPFAFPAVVSHKHRTRWNEANRDEWLKGGFAMSNYCLRNMLRNALIEHGARLGLDIDTLTGIHGAISPHVIRHLFGSHHCDPKRWPDAIGPEQASVMLHHASIKVTMDRYCGISERQITIGSDTYRRISSSKAEGRAGSAGEAVGGLVKAFEQGLIGRDAALRKIALLLDTGLAA